MAKKERKVKQELIDHYVDYVLETGEDPKTVFAFTKKVNIKDMLIKEQILVK